MKALAVFLLILIWGCGNERVNITYHYNVPQDELDRIAGQPKTYGYAWRESRTAFSDYERLTYEHWNCQIYLLSESELPNGCLPKVIAHERRHCYEGNFHEGRNVNACTEE